MMRYEAGDCACVDGVVCLDGVQAERLIVTVIRVIGEYDRQLHQQRYFDTTDQASLPDRARVRRSARASQGSCS